MLSVSSLQSGYGEIGVLEDISFDVENEIFAVLGANGAGKSTLLKAISGVCEGQVQGNITLNGTALVGMPADRIVEEGIALVPEGRGIFGDLVLRPYGKENEVHRSTHTKRQYPFEALVPLRVEFDSPVSEAERKEALVAPTAYPPAG